MLKNTPTLGTIGTDDGIKGDYAVIWKSPPCGIAESTGTIRAKLYPKWVNLHLSKSRSLDDWATIEGVKVFDKSILKVLEPEVLIAGCGTGQHSIVTAKGF